MEVAVVVAVDVTGRVSVVVVVEVEAGSESARELETENSAHPEGRQALTVNLAVWELPRLSGSPA